MVRSGRNIRGRDCEFMIETSSSSNRLRDVTLGLFLSVIAMLIAAAAFAVEPNSSADHSPGEYDVKAAYLYYFAKFVEWPGQFFSTKDSPIVIGIVGDDPFGSVLEKTISGKTAQTRGIVIHRPKTIEDLRLCHIVFISSSDPGRAAQLVDNLESGHVLTVCEEDYTSRSKCIISFVMKAGRVQFDVDVRKADKAGVKISSKLIMVSRNARPDAAKGRN